MIYLDNAATGYPKPECVYKAADNAFRIYGGNPSRSGHRLSAISSDAVYECREKVAGLFGASPENVVFTQNATYALNIAIKGITSYGDHFIISDMEHNAVFRPVVSLCESKGCSYDVVHVIGASSDAILRDIKTKIKPQTRAVIMNHSSNLCSFRIPVERIGKLCKENGILFVLDASQSAGHTDINMPRSSVNLLCAPAHKGLLGMMGLGILLSDGSTNIATLIEGGSGHDSANVHMPNDLPERLEAGTLAVPVISALNTGISFLSEFGINEIAEHEKQLFCIARDRLYDNKRVKIYLPDYEGNCFLFNVNGIPSEQIGEYLSKEGIFVRCGLHCAPLAHRALNTGEFGAVRVSFGIFNTRSDVKTMTDAINRLTK